MVNGKNEETNYGYTFGAFITNIDMKREIINNKKMKEKNERKEEDTGMKVRSQQ